VGKTALALNIAANIALRGAKEGEPPKRIAFFSMEMSKSQLVHRMVCTEAEVDSDELIPGPETTDEDKTDVMNRVWEAYDKIAGASIFINDTAGLTIQQVLSSIRQLQAEGGVDLIIIDYLQLMQANGGQNYSRNRQYEVSQISRELKALARDVDVPVLALSQLSRCVELRPNKRPMLSDLRESGSLEQDADIVMFLYRENYYNSEEPSHITELIVAKHRNGPTGKINLYFKNACTKFVGLNEKEIC
jgi:replicative DNA helicase